MARVPLASLPADGAKKSNVLSLEDDGFMAQVRFMYGPEEGFVSDTVHKDDCIKGEVKHPKYIACLRQDGEPTSVCPLCELEGRTQKLKREYRFYLQVYVISTTTCVNGIAQPAKQVNEPMLFVRPKSFHTILNSVMRQCNGTPLVNNVFNIVRNGKKGDLKTTYTVEFVTRDNTTLADLPQRISPADTYTMTEMSFEEMASITNAFSATGGGVQPRGAAPSISAQPQPQGQWNVAGQVSPIAPQVPY